MAKIARLAGSTSHVLTLFVQDSTSTTGAGLTGLTPSTSGLACYYKRNRGTASVAATLATITTLGTYVSGGFKEIDAANMPGFYEFHPPDAALAAGSGSVAFLLRGAASMVPCPVEVELTGVDNQDAVRAGLAALPAAAAAATGGLPTVDASNAVKLQSGTGANQISLSAGLVSLSGSQTTNITGNITGNLSGSVGSVTGAVGSVTGAVGSVSGVTFPANFGSFVLDGSGRVQLQYGVSAGQVNLSGGNLAGAVPSVTGNVGGNVTGSVGSVVGAVGSVTAEVAANLTHWLGVAPLALSSQLVQATASVSLGATAPAGWINTAAFAAGATIPRVTLADTLTTYTGNTPQTGDAFARLGAPAGASIAADIQTRSTYAGGAVASVTGNVGGNVTGSVGSIAGVTFPTNFAALGISVGGKINGVVLTDAATAVSNAVTVTGTPAVNVTQWLGSTPNALVAGKVDASASVSLGANAPAGWINAAAFAAGAVDASAFAQGAADKAWSSAARVLTAGTNIALAKGTGVTGFNDIAAAAVWDLATAGHTTGGTFGSAMNAAGSAGDPWATSLPGSYGAGTAGNILGTNLNAAVGSRMATFTYTAPDNASVAAIKAKTDNLPASPAAVGSAMTLTTAYDPAKTAAQAGNAMTLTSIYDPAKTAAPTSAVVAAAVWDLATAGHTTSGTFGSAMGAAGSSGDPWATALPGSYGTGTAGAILAGAGGGGLDAYDQAYLRGRVVRNADGSLTFLDAADGVTPRLKFLRDGAGGRVVALDTP